MINFISFSEKIDFENFVNEWMERVDDIDKLEEIEIVFLDYLRHAIEDKADEFEVEIDD